MGEEAGSPVPGGGPRVESPRGAEPSGFRGKSLFSVAAAAGVALDLWSKARAIGFVREVAGEGGQVPILPGFFYLADVENPGGVFGLGQNLSTVLAIARGVALLVILWFVRGTPRRERLHLFCLALLFAGALGNLHDNLTNHGRVRDFLDFYLLPPRRGHFPTFNAADSMICVGAFLLVAEGLFGARRSSTRAPGSRG